MSQVKIASHQFKHTNQSTGPSDGKFNTFRQNIPQGSINKLNYSQIQILNGISSISSASKMRTGKNSRKQSLF